MLVPQCWVFWGKCQKAGGWTYHSEQRGIMDGESKKSPSKHGSLVRKPQGGEFRGQEDGRGGRVMKQREQQAHSRLGVKQCMNGQVK